MEIENCPQCGSTKSWHFLEGELADSIWDRFDKISPDIGECWKCGFRYSEHIKHPLKEQIKQFRENRKKAHCRKCGDEIKERKNLNQSLKEILK